MNGLGTEPRTERTRRVSQGLALMVAPWAFVIANTGDVLTTDTASTTPRHVAPCSSPPPTRSLTSGSPSPRWSAACSSCRRCWGRWASCA